MGNKPQRDCKQSKQQQSDNRFDVFAQKWLALSKETRGRMINTFIYPIISNQDIYALILATRNTKDFIAIDGLMVFNPFLNN